MLKILKSKKGLTLVELVIGMVVLAIILATVSAILFPMMRFQARANELAEQNALLDNLANQIIYDISMATRRLESAPNVAIAPTPAPPHTLVRGPDGRRLIIPLPASVGGNITYEISPDGIIIRTQAGEPNPLLPGGFHQRQGAGLSVDSIAITLTTSPTTGTVYTITLTLSNENQTFQRPYAIRPLALNNS